MSEPFGERLSSLTPSTGAFDRDALLFEAGRRSARPNRLWRATAATLALSQAATLLILLFSSPQRGPISGHLQSPNVADRLPSAADLQPDSLIVIQRQYLENGIVSRSPVVENLAPPEPPLRAFGADLDRIIN